MVGGERHGRVGAGWRGRRRAEALRLRQVPGVEQHVDCRRFWNCWKLHMFLGRGCIVGVRARLPTLVAHGHRHARLASAKAGIHQHVGLRVAEEGSQSRGEEGGRRSREGMCRRTCWTAGFTGEVGRSARSRTGDGARTRGRGGEAGDAGEVTDWPGAEAGEPASRRGRPSEHGRA